MRVSALSLVVAVVGCMLLTPWCEAKVTNKVVTLRREAVFYDKFCFQGNDSQVIHRFYVPVGKDTPGQGKTGSSELAVDFLWFTDDHWQKVWPSHDCHTLASYRNSSQVGFVKQAADTETHTLPMHNHQRAHYWYFVLSSCEDERIIGLDLTLLNTPGYFTYHFSYDEHGLGEMYAVVLALFTVGAILHIRGVQSMGQTNPLHPIVRMLTAAVVTQWFSVGFIFVHYMVYASNGIGVPVLAGIGFFSDVISQVMFVYLLLCVAMGWGVTVTHIADKRTLVTTMIMLGLLYFTVFVWEFVARDPASTYYIYESLPGLILLAFRIVICLWFLTLVQRLLKFINVNPAESSKSPFLTRVAWVYGLWFISLPLICLIAALVDPWERAKTVTALYLFSNMVGFSYIGFWFWPSRAAEVMRIASDVLVVNSVSAYDAL
eukprot:GFYU01004255.1.p1 GENE.GFYU01004255.1~~GFYU01004255.1.p1  ORF type:complete len:432 (-),score=73.68 GFYU01004255.1:100-1395(-)